jgi:outer membrane murein-binding lipoprotein Lpp
MSKVIDEQIKKTELLISGLKNNPEVVKKTGLDENLVRELETENNVLNADNQELERIKKEAKEKSREANRKLTKLRKKYTEIKREVKKNTDYETWKQVGIKDRKR